MDMKQFIFDIETETMGSTLHPYQQNLLDKVALGGYKPGEMVVMTSGRQSGKSNFGTASMLKQWMDTLNEPKPITDLLLSHGTVYGARYYTVSPVGGNWKDMEEWCKTTFGEHGGAIWGADPNKAPLPSARWYMNNSKFWFRTEKDRDWFILRWSS